MLRLAKDFLAACVFMGACKGFALFLALPVPASCHYQLVCRKLIVATLGGFLGAIATILALALLGCAAGLVILAISVLASASLVIVIAAVLSAYGCYRLFSRFRPSYGIDEYCTSR